MKVSEIKEKLSELGVEYPSKALKPELEALLEEAVESTGEYPGDEMAEVLENDLGAMEDVLPLPEQEEDVPEVEEVTGPHVDVFDNYGIKVRTYSKSLHGKDYKSLAESFISRREGYTIK